MSEALTLRYFDARGRAQFLRYYLRVRNIEFSDERIPLEADFAAWTRIRDDESLTGPFHKLPVLETDDALIAEALVIAQYLHRRYGDADLLDTHADLRHRQLISSLYCDVTLNLGTLIWAERLFAGLDLDAYVPKSFERLRQLMQSIDSALGNWEWIRHMDRRPIMLADCLLWECIDWCRTVFGPLFRLESLPLLTAVHARFASGTAFAELLQQHPCPLTARIDEPDVIERIRVILSG